MSDTLVGVLIGVFFSLIIGYLVNWTSTPLSQKYSKWRDERAQKKARKSIKNARTRINNLEDLSEELNGYVQNPASLSAFSFEGMLSSLTFFCTAVFSCFLIVYMDSKIFPGIKNSSDLLINLILFMMIISAAVSFTMSIHLARRTWYILARVNHFAEFNETIQKEIADLKEVIIKFEAPG